MNFIEAFKAAVRKQKEYDKICVVISVDIKNATCVCDPQDGGSYLTDVMLAVGNVHNYVTIPDTGSVVVVSKIDEFTHYVSLYSAVKKVKHNATQSSGAVTTSMHKMLSEFKDDMKSYIDSLVNNLKTATYPHYMGPTSGPPLNQPAFDTAKVQLDTAFDKFQNNVDTLFEK